MSRGERLLLLAQALLRAEAAVARSERQLEKNREVAQGIKFSQYFSERALKRSWALLQPTREGEA
jgi:hypothetical protein